MSDKANIKVIGAKVHNLKNVDVTIPSKSLTVITGMSGSGKSSLAFDTIFAEGQRRYIDTFSSYARGFIGSVDRPDVDEIKGLSPVISIEQKTTNRNPRSTVGTVTEVYDYIRLLFAKAGKAYSYVTGEEMVKHTREQILDLILREYEGKKMYILAPLVKGRKGHYRELFETVRKRGYIYVRVDGEIMDVLPDMKVDRYKKHDIEVVVDKLIVKAKDTERLSKSIATAMQLGNGLVALMDLDTLVARYYSQRLMCPTTGMCYSDPEPNTFSFNSPKGACPRCKGLGTISLIDEDKIMPDKSLSVYDGGLAPLGKYRNSTIFLQIAAVLELHDCTLKTPISELPEDAIHDIIYGTDTRIKVKASVLRDGKDYFAEYEGLVKYMRQLLDVDTSTAAQKWIDSFDKEAVCPECNGNRLSKETLAFRVADKNIAELSNMEIGELYEWFDTVQEKLDNRQRIIAQAIIKEIMERLKFMLEVGLDYLTLSRRSVDLSGGESQRIRLATQIGSHLVNVLYVLDEPSIGLHQRDNVRLINSLKELRDRGNTVIVVEHDKDMMLNADYIIDMGPMAGRLGGEVVFEGKPEKMLRKKTITADYLNGNRAIELPESRRQGNGKYITIKGATGNNLKGVDAQIPLGMLVCVTGVSGSGKSSLINGTLQPILSQRFYHSSREPLPYASIEGVENIDKVVTVDQSPIGRTPRSNPSTYTGVFSDIRNLFTEMPESKMRGYKPGRFSFNVSGGRCETCKGSGYRTIGMNFLPDVYAPCEACHGKRYNRETLEVRFRGKSISDVLDMTINQAVEFFENQPHILNKIKVLQNVGLGYIKLGQASTTLSGGESQRVKLATELSKRDTGRTLFILDEPTTGLHFEDIRVLMGVLNKLVDKGNTVLVIEHNLDVIKLADHIIDMGPEGGKGGGKIVASGTPEEVSTSKESITSHFVAEELALTKKTQQSK